jgi:hypothetical protein
LLLGTEVLFRSCGFPFLAGHTAVVIIFCLCIHTFFEQSGVRRLNVFTSLNVKTNFHTHTPEKGQNYKYVYFKLVLDGMLFANDCGTTNWKLTF